MANMNGTNKGLHDLNLVRVVLTVWDTRNLTTAGGRLGLTQPAVSHALRRLRDTFADRDTLLHLFAAGGRPPPRPAIP